MDSVELMVFDMDGTLVRSGEDLIAAVSHTLKTLGLPALASETIRGFIGDGVEILVSRALGPHSGECLEQAMEVFSAHYTEHLLDHTTLYPDVLTVLDHFTDKRKVILTNKTQRYAVKISEGLGIASRFLEIVGGGYAPYAKPDPRLLHLVMEKWGAAPARTVMIGDGVNDILLARRAGALRWAFLGGLTQRDIVLSLHPDRTCAALRELKHLFV